ncbi:MAG: DUF3298 domain-containing protein, partial [Oscillibacter sp.]|nr:DUF3298 domain-containing protein [Oscillibacter sp.]
MQKTGNYLRRALLSAALAVTVLLSGCGGGTADVSRAPDIEPAPEPEVEEIPEAFRPVLGLTTDMEYHYDDDRDAIVNSMVTELPGADAATRDEYPALSEALDRFREAAHSNALDAYQEREGVLPDVLDAGDAIQSLGGEVRSMVRRADAKAVSIVNYWWDYSGGAYMSYGYGAVNFDTVSGAEIALEDLLTDEGKITINSRIGEELDALYTELSPGGMVADYLWDDYTFSIEPDGVTFWFNPYEIAAYSEGALTAKLYFDRDSDILKPDYRGDNDAWFVEIGTEIPYRFGGHSVEAWNISYGDDPDIDWYSGFGLEFDAPEGANRWIDRLTSAGADTEWTVPEGRTIVLDQNGDFEAHFYYAHIPAGDYVVALLTMEDDVDSVTVYRADGGRVSEMSLTGPGGFMYPEPPDDFEAVDDWSLYDSYHVALTNPNDVTLVTRFYQFGTWGGSGTYSLTPTGFQLSGKLLYNAGEYVLTLKQDLTVTRR